MMTTRPPKIIRIMNEIENELMTEVAEHSSALLTVLAVVSLLIASARDAGLVETVGIFILGLGSLVVLGTAWFVLRFVVAIPVWAIVGLQYAWRRMRAA